MSRHHTYNHSRRQRDRREYCIGRDDSYSPRSSQQASGRRYRTDAYPSPYQSDVEDSGYDGGAIELYCGDHLRDVQIYRQAPAGKSDPPCCHDHIPDLPQSYKRYNPLKHELSIDLIGIQERIKNNAQTEYSDVAPAYLKDHKNTLHHPDLRDAFNIVAIPQKNSEGKRIWRTELLGWQNKSSGFVLLYGSEWHQGLEKAFMELLELSAPRR